MYQPAQRLARGKAGKLFITRFHKKTSMVMRYIREGGLGKFFGEVCWLVTLSGIVNNETDGEDEEHFQQPIKCGAK